MASNPLQSHAPENDACIQQSSRNNYEVTSEQCQQFPTEVPTKNFKLKK